MPDPVLKDYDAANPPLAKLHILAQLDRDLAAFKTGRSRVAWKVFPIKDTKTKAEVARVEFNSDGGISITFNVATQKERCWSISAQALFDCVEEADRLYELSKTPQAKAKNLREKMKTPRPRAVKKAKRRNPGWRQR